MKKHILLILFTILFSLKFAKAQTQKDIIQIKKSLLEQFI